MTSILKRLLPVAVAAVALLLMPNLPARAASTPADQTCGNINLNTVGSDEAAKAFGCFTAAFQSCSPVSLVATGQEAAALVTRTFLTVDGDHGCSISEIVERSQNGTTTTDAYLCSGVYRDKDGLVFTGCGSEGNVALRPGGSVGKI